MYLDIKSTQLRLYLDVHLVGGHDVVHHAPDDGLLGLLLPPPPLPNVGPEEGVSVDEESADSLNVDLFTADTTVTRRLHVGLGLLGHHVLSVRLPLQHKVLPLAVDVPGDELHVPDPHPDAAVLLLSDHAGVEGPGEVAHNHPAHAASDQGLDQIISPHQQQLQGSNKHLEGNNNYVLCVDILTISKITLPAALSHSGQGIRQH